MTPRQEKTHGMDGLFEGFGLPNPQEILQEMKRLNTNIENMRGDIQTLNRHAETLGKLSGALQGINTANIRSLATAINNAQIPQATAMVGRALKLAEEAKEGIANRLNP